MRIEPGQRLLRALDLGEADARRVVHDLALQVVERYAIVVDDADGADAGCGQIHEHRRAEPARADDQHPGRLDLLLPLAAHLAQHQVSLVALDLFSRQGHAAFAPHRRSASYILVCSPPECKRPLGTMRQFTVPYLEVRAHSAASRVVSAIVCLVVMWVVQSLPSLQN